MSDVLKEVAEEQLNVEAASKKKGRIARPKTRKHLLTTTYKNDIAERLDKLHAAGHTVIAVVGSSDVRGFEVLSYTEE